jgi:hypothetical protein
MAKTDRIELREYEGGGGGHTEKREGKAWPSGETIRGNRAGSNTTAAAAKIAGALAGDGEGDALRISSLRWEDEGKEKRSPQAWTVGL